MPEPKLYRDADDFMASVDAGLILIKKPELMNVPADGDLPAMKEVFALMLVGVFDAEEIADHKADPDWDNKLSTLRAILLAGYNLGRLSGKIP